MLVLTMVLASALTAYGAVPEPSSAFYVADYADIIAPDTEEYIVNQNAVKDMLMKKLGFEEAE